jgi:hypothetical protein
LRPEYSAVLALGSLYTIKLKLYPGSPKIVEALAWFGRTVALVLIIIFYATHRRDLVGIRIGTVVIFMTAAYVWMDGPRHHRPAEHTNA